MGLLEQLQEQGWHLLPAGIERLLEGTTTGTTIEVKQAIKLALDIDLREIGGGALSSISSRGTKADTLDGNIVVQILKIRNISAPKANEESKVAPRLLKLTLTDGQTQYSALEGDHISALSLDTPPGTKLFLKNGPIKISQGLLILNAANVQVLGGKVPALVEKWELGRAMAKYAKGGRVGLSASGPPPWIAFGQKIQQNLPTAADKNFKSLQTKEKDESKENAEFNALRNDAIAEANKLGTKKTFGGGAKQMVDANVQKIMDKGFTEDEANHALKLTRNNVHRALSNLQRIAERNKRDQGEYKPGGKEEMAPKLDKRGGPRGKRDSESEASSKPSAKVSLFDFLEDILPESGDSANKKSSSKESTPFSGKNGKPGGEGYCSGKPSYNNSYPSSNSRAGNSAISGSSSGQYQSNSSSHYNKDYSSNNKSYNQQRFENNISSSFANRNSHPGPNPRGGYNQQQQSQQPQGANPSSGYKQSSSDYNTGGRYRGPPSETHPPPPRGPRPDSKYNQSHSSYNNNNPHQQQQQQNSQQYRNDGYNNNATSSGVPQSGKYAPNASGKSQPPNATSYGGYGHADSRNTQSYNGQADGSRKPHPNASSGHYQQQQQQGQSSYHSAPPPPSAGSKPIQGYNAPGSAGNQSLHQGNAAMNHYGQQQNAGGNSGYNSNVNSSKPKVSRYGKEEPPQKFSGPPPPMTTAPPQGGRKPPPPKIHQNSTQPTPGGQPPYRQQPSAAPPTGGPSPNSNSMAQLTDATANMQLNSKPFNSSNSTGSPQVMGAQAPKQPLQGPTTAAAPTVVPKNFIQLPNGFNYNPYQIMGFQNKQTNEFALNVLKSQQFDALQTAHLAAAGAPGGPPVQAVALQAPTAVVSSVLAPAGMPNWKVGDRCLAKYWEDGGFYNAEITGISENTFVVCFLEYGNYEEVLKTDCIPLTGGPPTAGPPPPHAPPPAATMGFHPQAAAAATHMMMPTGAYPGGPADSQPGQHFSLGGYKPAPPHQPSQYSHHHPPPPHHHHQQQQQQRPSKFREQRPMYVPPAQRK